MNPRIVALFLALALAQGPAQARDARIGTVALNLVAPAGYCDMDANNPSDSRMIGAVRAALATNTLLSVSANCGELDAWRVGKRALLDHFAQYQTLTALENAPLPGEPAQIVKQICAEARANGDKIVTAEGADMKARMEKALPAIQVNEVRFMGVLAEEPLVCYASTLGKMRAETGAQKTQIAMMAITVIKAKLIYYFLYAPYVDGDTITTMFTEHKANVAKLRAANP